METQHPIISEMVHPFDAQPMPSYRSNASPAPLPAWLSPDPPALTTLTPDPDNLNRMLQARTVKELELLQFELLFDRVLDCIGNGEWLGRVLEEDGRGFDATRYMRWIRADSERRSLYEAAQELATEKMTYDRIRIADGIDNPLEDVTRSRLRVEVRKDIAGSHNRKRYAPSQSVDVTTTISITAAINDARARVIENQQAEDVEFTEENP